MKETETIGRIVRQDTGRSFPILEMLSTEQGTFLLQGEQLQPFSSGIRKAIQAGYTLKDCADDRLRVTWKRLERECAPETVSIAATVSTTSAVTEVPEAPEAPAQEPMLEALPEEAETILAADAEPVMDSDAQEAEEAFPTVPTEPAQAEIHTFPLRDRRSPESPDSEEIRLRIAARDREMDQLQAQFAHQDTTSQDAASQEDMTVASETADALDAPDFNADMRNSMRRAPNVVMIGEARNASFAETVEDQEEKSVKAAEPETKPAAPVLPTATAESENEVDPFALF